MAKAIEIKDFSYEYPDGTKALSEVNLSIARGEKVALIGPNGAGKSTLLLAIPGFVKGQGQVYVNDLAVCKKNLKKIRKMVGSCLENPEDQLFMPTLFDDIAFGPLNLGLGSEQVKERVDETLRKVKLAGMGDKAPHHLSAGQKRAAAVATVLSMEPEIITLDEPQGNLDARNRNNLLELLKQLGQTLIIATCNMNFAAEIAERALVIDNGTIAAEGAAEDVMSKAGLMEEHGLEVPKRFI